MNYLAYIALFVGSCLAASGQVLLKLGADGASKLLEFVNFKIVFGLSAHVTGMLIWIWALSKIALNIAYAFTALTFIMVFIASAQILNERIMPLALLGLSLIVAGFLFVVFGGHEGTGS